MIKRLLILLFLMPLLLQGQVTIDMGSNRGAPTRISQGFLLSISANWPNRDTFVAPLKPRWWRLADYGSADGTTSAFGLYDNMKAMGVEDIQLVFDGWGDFAGQEFFGQTYEYRMTQLANRAVSQGKTFVWDIMNEPDLRYQVPSNITDTVWTINYYPQFLKRWFRTVPVLKSIIPTARTVGPALANFDSVVLKHFLDTCYTWGLAHGVNIMPNILAWHELTRAPEEINPANPDLYGNVQIMRNHLAAHPAYGNIEICIQEYTSPFGSGTGNYGWIYSPGSVVDHLAAGERLGVSMIKAVWRVAQVDTINTSYPDIPADAEPILGGIITYNKFGQTYNIPPAQRQSKPRATWWAHKYYADMTGKMLTVNRNQSFDGVASASSSTGKSIILIGNRQGHTAYGSVNVVLKNISQTPYLNDNGVIHAKVERLAESMAPVTNLPVLSNTTHTIAGDSAIIPVNILENEAVAITVSGTSSGTPENVAPTANAGSNQSTTGTSITLSGSGSDPDGSISTYAWSKVSGTGGSIVSPGAATTNITGLSVGTYVFRLTVTDNSGATATDDVTVTVNSVVAVPGDKKEVELKPLPRVLTGSQKLIRLKTTPAATAPARKWVRLVAAGNGGVTPPVFAPGKYYSTHVMVAYMPQVANMAAWMAEMKAAGYNLLWAHLDEYTGQYITALNSLLDAANTAGGIKVMVGCAPWLPIVQQEAMYVDTWNKPGILQINGKKVYTSYDYQTNNQPSIDSALALHGISRSQYLLWVHSRYPVNSYASSTAEVAGQYDAKQVDGFINFAVDQGFVLQQVISTNTYINQASKQKGKLSMAGVNAYYTSPPGGGRNDWGFTGIARTWDSILAIPVAQRPDGVAETTSNDYGEKSYISPNVVPPLSGTLNGQNVTGLSFIPPLTAGFTLGSNVAYPVTDHSGIQKFLRPWVNAFLNNQSAPSFTQDKIFCWYWLHPKGTPYQATVPAFFSSYGHLGQSWWTAYNNYLQSNQTKEILELVFNSGPLNGQPVTPGYGKIRMAAHLSAPAALKINGTTSAVFPAGPAYFEIDVPEYPLSSPITPTFAIVRNGVEVKAGSGPQAITNSPWPGNWNFISTEVQETAENMPALTAPAGPEGVTAPGDAFTLSASASPAAGTPTVAEYLPQAGPDETVVLTGHNLGSTAKVYNGSMNTAVVPAMDAESGQVRMPAGSFGMYVMWPGNAQGYGKPVAVNKTTVTWMQDYATAGMSIHLYGRNLARGNLEGSDNSFIYIKPSSGSGQFCTVTAVNPYRVTFTVPAGLAAGTYTVWAHNGHGGNYGWSEPLTLNLLNTSGHVKTRSFGATYSILSYGAVTGDTSVNTSTAINAAASAANSAGGGVVVIPAGVWTCKSPLVRYNNVKYSGETSGGVITSILKIGTPYTAGDYGFFGNDFSAYGMIAFENIEFQANGISVGESFMILNNPTMLWFKNCHFNVKGFQPFRMGGASNVFFDGCKFTGADIFMDNTNRIWFDSCVFKMTHLASQGIASEGALLPWSMKRFSITNSTCSDLSTATNEQGTRFISGNSINGSSYYQYFAGNTITGVGPQQTGGGDLNRGETFLWEGAQTKYQANALSATSTTVTFSVAPSSSDAPVGAHLTIAKGRGVGQVRMITGLSGATVTVDKPFNVVPDATSLVQTGFKCLETVVYKNTIDASSKPHLTTLEIGQTTASTGVNFFANCHQNVFAGNTVIKTRSGMANMGTQYNAPRYHPNSFNLYEGNTINGCVWGIFLSSYPEEDADNMVGTGVFASVYRRNTLTNLAKPNIYYGIVRGRIYPGPVPSIKNILFEHNKGTTTPTNQLRADWGPGYPEEPVTAGTVSQETFYKENLP